MGRGNPNFKLESSTPLPRADSTTSRLAIAVTSVKLPVDIDEKVRSLPNRTAWLRRVITEAAERELMNKENTDDE